ncbi:hypothetical protein [Xanthomonas sp. NCPPB 2632]|uniref:hypothetical protein n=1 Tax=Xanthomonas sp. NCPPB 2632 TaxID=3240912 RepID=UPI003518C8EF
MTTQREADFLAAAYASGITSPKELANLMGQVSHESGGLTRMEESFRYPGGLKDVPVASARNSPDGESAHQAALDGDPKPLAELMYGGKMGNAPGEGYTYRGRGYIQLTGHDNYEAMGNALGLNLRRRTPSRMSTGAISPGCWWLMHGPTVFSVSIRSH